MIFEIQDFLTNNGVSKENIHFELFTASGASDEELEDLNLLDAKVTMIIDDDEFDFNYDPSTKESMLEAGIDKGLDLPFSCKGGVCCTCKAKIMEGKAVMTVNYALTDDEVEEGYILTCQSYPTHQTLQLVLMNKTVFITGATSGIGEALCDMYYNQGWNVIACGRSESKLKEVSYKYKKIKHCVLIFCRLIKKSFLAILKI